MATWFQQKIKAVQESGFHSRVWKSCVFRILIFQADSPIYAPFCSILTTLSTSSPYGCITPWYFNFFFCLLIASFLFAFSVSLVSSLGASLRFQDLPFLMGRQSPCLTKPSSPFKTVETLFHPLPCFCVFPISLLFSHFNINQSCIFFLPCCWSLFLSPGTCLSVPHVILSYCFVCFSFLKVWPRLLEQAGPSTSFSRQILLTDQLILLCPSFDLHWTDFCSLQTKWRKIPLCVARVFTQFKGNENLGVFFTRFLS